MNLFPHQFRARSFSLVALLGLLAACAAPDTPTTGAPAGSGAGSTPASPAGSTSASAGGSTAASGAGGDNDCERVSSDIKIGFNTSLTGGTADLGEGQRKGFKLALKEYNEKGGYQGQKVQCILLDDGTKPESGLANITRLIDQDRVLGLIAFANTGAANAALDKVQQSQIPMIIPVATGTVLTQKFINEPKNYVFRMSMPDVSQVGVMMDFLQKSNLSKPAIMHDTSGYGKLGAEDITKALQAKGQVPVATENFQYGDTDMTGQLTRARNAGADVVMTYALAPELANLIKSMDRIGWTVPIVGSWTLAQPDMVKFATEDVVKKFNVYMVQSFTIDRDDVSRAYHQKIETEYGAGQNLVPITSAQGYDATNLMLQALDKAGPNAPALRDAIAATTDFKGVTTAPAQPYADKDHEAIEQSDMFIATWKETEGQLRVVRADQ